MGVIQPSWAPRTSRLITIPMTLEKPPVLTCLHWWQQKNDGKTTTKCCDCSAKRMNPKYGLVWNYGAKLWGLNHQFPHEHVPYLGGFAGLPSCWALLVSLGSGQPEPRNICIAKGLRLDLFQDLKSETSETSGLRFIYYLMVANWPRNSIEKISDITGNCPKTEPMIKSEATKDHNRWSPS